MRFSVSKAIVYGVTMTVALAIGFLISGTLRTEAALIGAVLGGVLGGALFGYMMREARVDVAGATPQSIEAAVRGSWALRSFKAADAGEGRVRYTRSVGPLGDSFLVTPTATGVTLTGAANIMNVVKRKAAGR